MLAFLNLKKTVCIFYVLVPANRTDMLPPLGVSTSKPAKDSLVRSKFQTWYVDKLSAQLDEKSSYGTPLKLVKLKYYQTTWGRVDD